MNKKYRLGITVGVIVAAVALIVAAAIYLHNYNLAVLAPKGIIASQQRNLLVFGTIMSLVVRVPVFVLTFYIVWKYRESNIKAR